VYDARQKEERRRGRVFFSEEKNQKTFTSALVRPYPAMAGNHPPAEN
jgi:hypothetical protein